MIDLTSDRWQELTHAYGSAEDTPERLRRAAKLPPSVNWQTEPYYSLWSSLCHQGDCYTASYAAVPHIVSICRSDLSQVNRSLVQLVVCIEVARLSRRGPEVPDDIHDAYFKALAGMPELIVILHAKKPSEDLAVIGAAALAVNSGLAVMARAFLEMNSEIAPQFLEWFSEL